MSHNLRNYRQLLKEKKMKESFNVLSNLVNFLSTELIVDAKIKAKQLTDLQLFSHFKKYT